MPIWYHVGGTDRLKSLNNSKCGRCLRTNHKVRSVGDLLKVVRRENNYALDPPHVKNNHCPCRHCTSNFADGCRSPHSCTQCAKSLLDRLHDTWKTSVKAPQDGLTLTPRRLDANERALTITSPDNIELKSTTWTCLPTPRRTICFTGEYYRVREWIL
ncbi:hypothetical protein K474DRAFT_1657774 [Panus rudis PR-1116 ss-1]|nr:hypothetical protein K474DRAFT_1657774 [Panus rudis PR-1116 ss-1]